jgi:hypothetical protein
MGVSAPTPTFHPSRTHFGPADMVGQLSALQKSDTVPYSSDTSL